MTQPLNKKKFMLNASLAQCLVIGDVMLDEFISGNTERISPEAPIPVIEITGRQSVLGGAAHVAASISAYHIPCILCGVLGEDGPAQKVKEMLAAKNIVWHGIASANRTTTVKTRITSKNQQLLRLDSEQKKDLDEAEQAALWEQIENLISGITVIVLSDYNKGVCTPSFCQSIIRLAKASGIPVIVDPKTKDWTRYAGATLLTPNFSEFVMAADTDAEDSEAWIHSQGTQLIERFTLKGVLITRSHKGMTLVQGNDACYTIHATAQEVCDVAGAGDTVVATIAAFLAAGYPFHTALEYANFAAGIAVSRFGTYVVSLDDLCVLCSCAFDEKTASWEEAAERLLLWKSLGLKTVFTNGCFDVLHRGHVEYLSQAKNLGDKLIIGLNSDTSVQRLKGNGRPINSANDRARILSAMSFVDMVVIFEQDTPLELIKMVKPSYLVKGADYAVEDIVGREWAEKTITLPFADGYSTTGILAKIESAETKGQR